MWSTGIRSFWSQGVAKRTLAMAYPPTANTCPLLFIAWGIESESESEVAQSCPTLCHPWTVAHQPPPSMGFSRQEYCSGLPFPYKYTINVYKKNYFLPCMLTSHKSWWTHVIVFFTEFKECWPLMFCPWMEMSLLFKITGEENGKLRGKHLRSIVSIPKY